MLRISLHMTEKNTTDEMSQEKNFKALEPSNLQCYALRMHPGEEIKSKLQTFVSEKKLSAAFIMTCVGSVTKATLRMAKPDLENSERIKTFNRYFEIVSLVGTFSSESCHLHISLSDKNGEVIGGHVIGDLIVYTTAEIVIGNCENYKFERYDDAETGWPELKILEKNN